MLNAHPRTLAALSLIAGVLTAAAAAIADPPEHHSPYAGQRDVSVTGLLPDEAAALEQGKGMAQALPAEVNGYPGPLHVLEAMSAGTLALRPEQLRDIEEIHDRMSRAAVEKGQEILESEATLARRFRHRHIDETVLHDLTAEIAGLRGELRAVHLLAHLETTAVLTPQQIAEYQTLRGYDREEGAGDGDAHSHHHGH